MRGPIGIFDSGLGGLSVVKHLCNMLPWQDIIYFGDTGRVPYGSRSPETIEKYANQDIKFLLKQDVSMIIAACGTVSSVVPHAGDSLEVPFLGVVEPAVKAAVKASKNGKIGVIGTAATINSRAYTNKLFLHGRDLEVYEQACPLLVPLVEAGWIDEKDKVTREVLVRYLTPLKEKGIDTLILGCTHYPLLKGIISDVMGKGVTLIDTGLESAKAAVEIISPYTVDKDRQGKCSFYVSDKVDGFREIAEMFLGYSLDNDIKRVDIERI